MITLTPELAALCRNYEVRTLSVFGSELHGTAQSTSDLDLLVEFQPGKRMGLKFFRLECELSDLLQRTVDLNTAGFLSRYFRDQVIRDAQPIYVAE